jgi:hypothetical protein
MMLSIYWEGSEDITDFNRAISLENYRKEWKFLPLNNTFPVFCYCYKEIAHFSKYIKYYLENFNNENIFVIISEDFMRNPKLEFKRVCNFLNIRDSIDIEFIYHNRIGKPWSNLIFRFLSNINGNIHSKKLKKYIGYLWKINMSNKNPCKIDNNTYQQLQKEFEPEVMELSRLLKKDLFTQWQL